MKKFKLLVCCEESQRVCTAFRERGWEAYSCDIEPCSGGHPECHIQQAVNSRKIRQMVTLGIVKDVAKS